MNTRYRLALALALALLAGWSRPGRADLLTSYDLVVTGSLSSSSEATGPTLIVGSLSGTSNYGNVVAGSPATLIVGGSISGTANVNGNVLIGGTYSGNVNANGGGTVTIHSSYATSLASSAPGLLATANQAFDNLTTNGATPTVPGQNGNLTFTVGSNVGAHTAVFTIDASELNQLPGINAHIALSTSADPSVKSIVIDVTNTTNLSTVNFAAFDNSFQTTFGESDVMWNFVSTAQHAAPSTIDLSTDAFFGAILAPNSLIDDNSHPINGAVFVSGFSGGQTGEVHVPLYTGYDPLSAVPEPTSIALMGVGLAIALGVSYRSRRRAAA